MRPCSCPNNPSSIWCFARNRINILSYLRKYYNIINERLRYIDGEIVLDSLAQLGYKAHFESKEKYFWIEEVQIGTYTFSSNMILDGGLVDIVWIVKENGNLILGLPIGEYSRLMIAPNYKIKKPIFGTYEDLDEIVESVFKLFEDFKKAMTAS